MWLHPITNIRSTREWRNVAMQWETDEDSWQPLPLGWYEKHLRDATNTKSVRGKEIREGFQLSQDDIAHLVQQFITWLRNHPENRLEQIKTSPAYSHNLGIIWARSWPKDWIQEVNCARLRSAAVPQAFRDRARKFFWQKAIAIVCVHRKRTPGPSNESRNGSDSLRPSTSSVALHHDKIAPTASFETLPTALKVNEANFHIFDSATNKLIKVVPVVTCLRHNAYDLNSVTAQDVSTAKLTAFIQSRLSKVFKKGVTQILNPVTSLAIEEDWDIVAVVNEHILIKKFDGVKIFLHNPEEQRDSSPAPTTSTAVNGRITKSNVTRPISKNTIENPIDLTEIKREPDTLVQGTSHRDPHSARLQNQAVCSADRKRVRSPEAFEPSLSPPLPKRRSTQKDALSLPVKKEEIKIELGCFED